jgi:cell division protein FtsB
LYLPAGKATVLLIGSTGNGKSSLGNFLFDPFDDETLYDYEKQYFKTSRDAKPHTNETKVVWKNVVHHSFHHRNLTVIDTPGLNDLKNRKNMICLMKALDLEGIHTCIVVVKFDGKIDNQFKETIKYYFKLLPDLFGSNLIVVVTHYSQDRASITRRKKLEIDEEVIKRDILDAVCAITGLSADPTLFMIDCLPAQGENISLNVRDEILDYVFNQEPIIPQFKVAKLPSQMQEDKEMYDRLSTERSRQMYSNNPTLQKELEVMENAILNLKADRKQLKEKMDDLNTEELVDHVTWRTRKRWTLSSRPSDRYNLETSPHMIRDIVKNGSNERWRHEQRGPCTLSGRVEARRSHHGFNASIILRVYKKDKCGKEITNLKKQIAEIDGHLNIKEMERIKLIEAHEKKSNQLIEEARQENQKYLDEYMTVDEAIEQLSEGNSRFRLLQGSSMQHCQSNRFQ